MIGAFTKYTLRKNLSLSAKFNKDMNLYVKECYCLNLSSILSISKPVSRYVILLNIMPRTKKGFSAENIIIYLQREKKI